MQLAAHEAFDLHELAMSCVNSITNMAYFMNHVQDQELKALLQQHFPFHIKDYNMKVQYLSQAQGAASPLPVPELNPTLQSYTQPNTTTPVTPRTTVQDMNDREMATAYLLTLKRAGREYAWAAMEMSNPEIRTFLEDGFRMSSRHAYDVWQWMVKKGYYPLEPAAPITLNTLGKLYNTVPESAAMTMQ
ncbi:spore coat protein [Brevibacillus massiliensis]|uniref:spore coat protein n=1 Tax=Brevibacillus massiliensis TaxID=1118054 RepID=UPI00031A9578|nr:spore coat protein [Brevibacillus massiliensis]